MVCMTSSTGFTAPRRRSERAIRMPIGRPMTMAITVHTKIIEIVRIVSVHMSNQPMRSSVRTVPITIGQTIYSTEHNFSNRTMQNQSLPLGVDIVARKGCDFVVQNLITALHQKGFIRSVKTGSSVH